MSRYRALARNQLSRAAIVKLADTFSPRGIERSSTSRIGRRAHRARRCASDDFT